MLTGRKKKELKPVNEKEVAEFLNTYLGKDTITPFLIETPIQIQQSTATPRPREKVNISLATPTPATGSSFIHKQPTSSVTPSPFLRVQSPFMLPSSLSPFAALSSRALVNQQTLQTPVSISLSTPVATPTLRQNINPTSLPTAYRFYSVDASTSLKQLFNELTVQYEETFIRPSQAIAKSFKSRFTFPLLPLQPVGAASMEHDYPEDFEDAQELNFGAEQVDNEERFFLTSFFDEVLRDGKDSCPPQQTRALKTNFVQYTALYSPDYLATLPPAPDSSFLSETKRQCIWILRKTSPCSKLQNAKKAPGEEAVAHEEKWSIGCVCLPWENYDLLEMSFYNKDNLALLVRVNLPPGPDQSIDSMGEQNGTLGSSFFSYPCCCERDNLIAVFFFF